MSVLRVVFIIIVLCSVTHIHAQAEDDIDFNASLNQLAEIKVETASRQLTSLQDAPGIVSVYTHEDIRAFGGFTLFDVLNRIPGVQSHIAPGIDRVTVRGGEPNASLVRVLVLLDGKPLRVDNGNTGTYALFYAFPLEHIERIEVIRGPGSVLYGTYAVEGVINIVTRTSQPGKTKASVLVGDWNTTLLETSLFSVDEHVDISIGSRLFYSDRPPFTTGHEGNPDSTFILRKPDMSLGLVGSATVGKLSASFYASHIEAGVLDRVPQLLPQFAEIDLVSRVTQVSLGWEERVFGDGVWTLSYTRNFEEFEWELGEARALYFTNYMQQVESTLDLHLSEELRLLGGYSTTLYEGDPSSNYDRYALWLHRLFAQADYSFSPQVRSSIGLEVNKGQEREIDITPRLAVTWNDGPWGMKFLLAQAYRAPGATELILDNPPYEKSRSDLLPERTTTLDIQAVHNTEISRIALTGFYSRSTDLLRYQPDPNDTSYNLFAGNSGSSESRGLELETRFWFGDLKLSASATWYMHTLDDTLDQYTLAPELVVKTGAQYTLHQLEIGAFVNAQSAAAESDLRNPLSLETNPSPEPVALVDLSVRYELSELLGTGENSRFWAKVYVSNLLDTVVYGPDVLYYRLNSLPVSYGRIVTLGIVGTL